MPASQKNKSDNNPKIEQLSGSPVLWSAILFLVQLVAHRLTVAAMSVPDRDHSLNLLAVWWILFLSFTIVWQYRGVIAYIKQHPTQATPRHNILICSKILITSSLIAYAFYLTTQHAAYKLFIAGPSWGLS